MDGLSLAFLPKADIRKRFLLKTHLSVLKALRTEGLSMRCGNNEILGLAHCR